MRTPAGRPHLHALAPAAVDQPRGHRATTPATTTRTGITVSAELDTASYPAAIEITDRQMKDLEEQAPRLVTA